MSFEPLVVPVYYDFASTIAYVAHRVTERLAADLAALEVELVWRPVDLVRITGWPRGVVVEGPRRDNALAVAAALGVAVRMPGCWLDSRAAHAVALHLADSPHEAAWRERVWCAVHEEGSDLSADEIRRLAADLDVAVPDLADTRVLGAVEEATRRAHALGVTGVPTFLLGQWPMGGIQDDDTMRALLGRYVRKVHRGASLH